jgi:hypothetical protein
MSICLIQPDTSDAPDPHRAATACRFLYRAGGKQGKFPTAVWATAAATPPQKFFLRAGEDPEQKAVSLGPGNANGRRPGRFGDLSFFIITKKIILPYWISRRFLRYIPGEYFPHGV